MLAYALNEKLRIEYDGETFRYEKTVRDGTLLFVSERDGTKAIFSYASGRLTPSTEIKFVMRLVLAA